MYGAGYMAANRHALKDTLTVPKTPTLTDEVAETVKSARAKVVAATRRESAQSNKRWCSIATRLEWDATFDVLPLQPLAP
jgi:hypothetical protein